MRLLSKRNTLHLTKDKYYDVMDKHFIKDRLFRVSVMSDVGHIIETHIDNFYSIEEVREFKIKEILK
jgi:pentose-5-phosphate-3-epimerase